VRPAPPRNHVTNTFIHLVNQTININNCNSQLKVTYNLVSNFFCYLRSHLPSFLGAGHLSLHVLSDGRWRINDSVSNSKFRSFLQLFSFSSPPSTCFLEIHNPHEITREGQCFVSRWSVSSFAHPIKIKDYRMLWLLTIISKFKV